MSSACGLSLHLVSLFVFSCWDLALPSISDRRKAVWQHAVRTDLPFVSPLRHATRVVSCLAEGQSPICTPVGWSVCTASPHSQSGASHSFGRVRHRLGSNSLPRPTSNVLLSIITAARYGVCSCVVMAVTLRHRLRGRLCQEFASFPEKA